jgi:hypothetical protein
MRVRTICAIAASLLLALACGGGAFSAEDGSGGVGASSGENGSGGTSSPVGGKNQGGKAGTGPVSGTAGTAPGGGGSASGGNFSGGSASGGTANGGESSGGDASGGAGDGGPECTLASDCQASTKCRKALCLVGGTCGEENLPNGPYVLQVTGDCKRLECKDGKEVIVADPADADDKNECTTDSCQDAAVHTPRYGEQCAGGAGICSALGKCELCSRDTCPAATDCSMPICAEGRCTLGPKPSGTFCKGFEDQCDGAGNCIDCVNSGGCGECCVCSPQHACVPA